MSNEHHDIAAQRAAELGYGGTADAAATRDALFACVTNNAFKGRPSLIESGLRILIMAGRCCVPVPPLERAETLLLRKIAVQCNGGLSLPPSEDARRVFELILGAEVTPWRIGRRASLLAYGLNRSVIIHEVLPSFECIGELWKLKASNKRSAVSAAMNKLRAELVKNGQLPSTFRFWFEKTAEARAVYEQAQIGNTNRGGHNRYEAEMLEGVPVKPVFAAMKLEQRRAVLRELHAAAEMKRLGLSAEAGILNRR